MDYNLFELDYTECDWTKLDFNGLFCAFCREHRADLLRTKAQKKKLT